MKKIRKIVAVLCACLFILNIYACSKSVEKEYNLSYYVYPIVEEYEEEKVYGLYPMGVVNSMVELFKSDVFAEKILLNNFGLPDEYSETAEYKEALNAVLKLNTEKDNLLRIEQEIKNLKNELVLIQEEIVYQEKNCQEQLNNKQSAEKIYISLQQNGASSSYVSESRENVIKATNAYDAAKLKYDELFEKYIELQNVLLNTEKLMNEGKSNVLNADKEATNQKEVVLTKWRENKGYKNQLDRVKNSIKYSCLDNKRDYDGCFFFVNIKITNDSEYALFLLNKIKEILPKYVSEKMPIQWGYRETKCLLISYEE